MPDGAGDGGIFMKTVFITGAAGSLGRILTRQYVDKRCVVRAFDIDEGGLANLKEQYGDWVRPIYGSIVDMERLSSALSGSHIVVHTAAIKNILISEDNPWETIRTNVKGTYNVAQACATHGVRKAIFISSDKAVESTLLYGDSKAISEKLWIWSNRHSEHTRFSIIRSGNFTESNGNVLETWARQVKQGPVITLTDPQMERYFIPTEDMGYFVQMVEDIMLGGEIFIPTMVLHKLHDMAKDYARKQDCKIEITGVRAGEKLIEKLYSQDESTRIEFNKNYMVIK